MSPRYAAKVDTNQDKIVEALRRVGAHVQPIHRLGGGVPDLLCSFRMRWYVLEVKAPGGTLTPDECEFIQAARAEVHVVTTQEEALQAIGAITGGAVPAAIRPAITVKES